MIELLPSDAVDVDAGDIDGDACEDDEVDEDTSASIYSAHSTALNLTTLPIALSKLLTPASLV